MQKKDILKKIIPVVVSIALIILGLYLLLNINDVSMDVLSQRPVVTNTNDGRQMFTMRYDEQNITAMSEGIQTIGAVLLASGIWIGWYEIRVGNSKSDKN